MMISKERRAKAGLHPRAVARAFHVHLRTVFRWFKKDLIRDSVQPHLAERSFTLKLLRLWRSTCTMSQAMERLESPSSTIIFWKKKGELAVVKMFGIERITKASIEDLIVRHNAPRWDTDLYCSLEELAGILGLSLSMIYQYMRAKRIRFLIEDGASVVTRQEANRLSKLKQAAKGGKYWLPKVGKRPVSSGHARRTRAVSKPHAAGKKGATPHVAKASPKPKALLNKGERLKLLKAAHLRVLEKLSRGKGQSRGNRFDEDPDETQESLARNPPVELKALLGKRFLGSVDGD